MAAVTSDPSCFELSDDGTNGPESDVSCTSLSAAVAADHGSQCAGLCSHGFNRRQLLLQTLL